MSCVDSSNSIGSNLCCKSICKCVVLGMHLFGHYKFATTSQSSVALVPCKPWVGSEGAGGVFRSVEPVATGEGGGAIGTVGVSSLLDGSVAILWLQS